MTDDGTADPLVGRTLAGFRILRRLGAGGMGVVYEAEERALGRTVALKLLPEKAMVTPERHARFLREARAAAAVSHPCVTTVYQVGTVKWLDVTEDGEASAAPRWTVFMAMELVRGETLRRRMDRGPLPIGEAVRIAAAIAGGLGRAHEAGIVHRDIKPDNVMLTDEGQVKILDFGIARMREIEAEMDAPSFTTAEGRIIGTHGYMSPEQARGGEIDRRSDLFALGIVLYEMLAGTRPSTGHTPLEVPGADTRDLPPLLQTLPSAVRESLATIVDRCLAKSP